MSNLPITSAETRNLQQLFNGSFYQSVPVDQGTYGIIHGFFLDRTNLKEAADSLTQSILTIGYNNKINPLDVLKEFDKVATESDFKKVVISLINSGRLPTSKVGYNRGNIQNKWAARNVVP